MTGGSRKTARGWRTAAVAAVMAAVVAALSATAAAAVTAPGLATDPARAEGADPRNLPEAAAAPPGDDIAQRVRACTGCHGREGRAASDGYYPRIAGKPAGYLHNQLLNFRDGRRSYPLMTHLLENLTDEYLQEIAAHFAALDIPYPPPQPATVDASTFARGRMLAIQGDPDREIPACADCHGRALTGVAPAVPGLLGLPRDYLNAQFGAWRIGQREATAPDCMARIVRQLRADDVAAVSAWLAAQPVPADARPAAAPAAPMPMRCGGMERP